MKDWFSNGWKHWEMTALGLVLSAAVLYQQEFQVSSFWLSAVIFVLGWIVKTPTKE